MVRSKEVEGDEGRRTRARLDRSLRRVDDCLVEPAVGRAPLRQVHQRSGEEAEDRAEGGENRFRPHTVAISAPSPTTTGRRTDTLPSDAPPARRRLAAALCLALGGCAGNNPFLQSTSAFAKVTDGSVGALAGAPRLGREVCRLDADYALMRLRLENLDDGWGARSWSGAYEAPRAELGGKSWRDHCERMAAADDAFAAALTALKKYAGGLHALAEKGTYEGGDLTSLGRSATGLASSAGDLPQKTQQAVASLGGAITGLGNALVAAYTAGRIRQLVTEADPHLHALLSAVERLLAAEQEQHGIAREKLGHVLDLLDARMKQHPSDPAQAIAFFDFSRRALGDLARLKERLDHCTDLVAHLVSAHAKLSAAARTEDPRAEKEQLAQLLSSLDLGAVAAGGTEVKDALRILLEIEHTLSELIIHAAPASDDDVDAVRQLARLRDRIDGGINRLMELRVEAATADLTKATHELGALNAEIEKLDARLAAVRQGVTIAAKVVDAVAALLKLILAA